MTTQQASAGGMLFDPADPAVLRDPFSRYRLMREQAPIWESPEGIFYLTRYEDCFTMFRSPDLSYQTTATRAFQATLPSDPVERKQRLDLLAKNRNLLDTDPPEHTRLRSHVNRAFSALAVERMRPDIEGIVHTLIDQMIGRGSADLVADFGQLVPIYVICAMLGVPPEERSTFVELGNRVGRAIDPGVSAQEKIAAPAAMIDYMGQLTEARRRAPADDVLSHLIASADDGDRLTQNELLANSAVLLQAGFETTTNLIVNAIICFLDDRPQLELALNDPDVMRSGIEEVLRFRPPVHFMRPRAITRTTEIGGQVFEAGDAVVPVMAAANHDPAQFPEPDRFEVTRTPNRHLSFGVGHHLCVGSSLARAEGAIAVGALFRRLPTLALAVAEEDLEYRPNLTLPGVARLPVTW
jgi:cytochrome P450 PksS